MYKLRNVRKMKDINLCSVAATTSMGGGLRRLCNDLNLPLPLNEKPYNNYLSYLKTCAVKNSERSIRAAAHELRTLKLEGEEDVSQLREKCPNKEFFLVPIQSEYRKIRTRKNSVFEHFQAVSST